MRLEHISAVLRPRSDAEAVDLGLAMVRRHSAGIYKAWFTLLLPLWGLLIALLHHSPSLVVFIAWWLKPVYDRVVLFYLGRALFGAPPPWREQLREWPKLLRQRLGLSLFWGRLSGVRSFTMPVVVLEGLTGKLYKDRTAILKRHGGSAAFGCMQVSGLLELAVTVGLWIAIQSWLPGEYTDFFAIGWGNGIFQEFSPPAGLLWSVAGCYLTAVALVEPFYAGAGFGLYINSRTHLEGWDVDLAFRQLGARLRARQAPPASSPPILPLLAAGLMLGGGCLSPANAQALDQAQAKSQIKEILTQPEFEEHVKKYRSWEWIHTPSPPEPEPEGWDWSWLTRIWDGIAGFFPGDWKEVLPRMLLALGMVALAMWVARLLWKHRQSLIPHGPAMPKDHGPRTVAGLDVTPESLPLDIPAAAWAAWQGGDPTAAVKLLYRGSLAWLMGQGAMPIRESDTEGDCLRHAGLLPDAAKRAYFSDLTDAWLATAYGQCPPATDLMQTLCADWPFHSKVSSPALSLPKNPALALLLLCAVVGLTGCKGKWVDREEELGHQGDAKRNPWLAATRFLELNDIPVMQQRGINVLPDGDSVIVAPAQAINSEMLAQRLLDWTKRGGHLIYLAEGGEHYRNDWSSPLPDFGGSEGKHPLLAILGVDQTEKPRASGPVGTVSIDHRDFRVSLQENLHFDLTSARDSVLFSTGNRSQSVLASLRYGSGRITLVAHAAAFRNRWIDDDDHAALLLALVKLTDPAYSVTFIKAGRINLWDMLLEHAWPVLLALVLLLLFWLWRVLPRFGPVRELPRRFERRFASDLTEAGTFLWKQRLTDSLLEAPRQAVFAAARRHGLREGERLFADLLATRAGLAPERVHDALYAGNLTDSKLFTRHMADLQTLLAALQFHRPPS